MTETKKRKQMAFDVSPEIHQQIKVLAAMRNISINLWMARAISDRITKETKYDNKPEE
jgi:predicted HicB family RNase H-like nuclease